MQLRNATRTFNLLGIVASLGLASCVFTWGLEYKLSLYDPPQWPSHQIPQAKLLSRNEQSVTTAGPLVVRTKTSTRVSYTVSASAVFLVLLLAPGVLNLQGAGQRFLCADPVRIFHRGLFELFLNRPPPFLA